MLLPAPRPRPHQRRVGRRSGRDHIFDTKPIRMLFLSAVLNGILAPPLLALIMLVSNDRQIMGQHMNGPCLNVLGWTATVLMAAARSPSS